MIGLAQLSIVIYKVYTIGLFPNYASDWIDLVPINKNSDYIVA